MRVFLTGSRVYGTPSSSSDIDMVAWVTPAEREILASRAVVDESYGSDANSFMFGGLNVLVVSTEEAFNAWRQGTEELKAKAKIKPVTREEAKKHFRDLRASLGLSVFGGVDPRRVAKS